MATYIYPKGQDIHDKPMVYKVRGELGELEFLDLKHRVMNGEATYFEHKLYDMAQEEAWNGND